jgi:biopolymer transport protein ExbD
MKRRHIPESHSTHPNVTPLIDVVMCLIIFFMLITKIGVNTGADTHITIPASILGNELKDQGNALTLNVREGPGDQPMVTALVEAGSAEPQEIKLIDTATGSRPLLKLLQKLREGDAANNIPANPDFKIIIRADKEMGYRFLAPVLEQCMLAKVKNVNFNTAKAAE